MAQLLEPPKMRPARCSKCGYQWWTRSHRAVITCPNCNSKVRVKDQNR